MKREAIMEPETDRVRRHTARDVIARIDEDAFQRLIEDVAAPKEATSARLKTLDGEWDVDRVVETEAAITALAGLALGLGVDRRFMVIPGVVAGMVLLYAVRGWYPLLPLFRRLGLRTSREIQRERYALKTLRGDFDALPGHTYRPTATAEHTATATGLGPAPAMEQRP